ncbi:hypothetical protein [Mucilaginibacter sp.]|uniref:hypothetical protein n=1 Tax=Mucilaginibacter sp. TaxID=1882438 RepID=UPI003D13BFBE
MKQISIILFIFFPSFIFAQANYRAGYFLKNNGDTVKGFINYREWDQSPTSIEFKYNKDDKDAIQLSPNNTKAFQVTGKETYITYNGFISMDKTRFPELPDHFDTTKKIKTVFFKLLTTGQYLTLYYHNDEIKPRYFIAEKDHNPVELKYYSYYNDDKEIKYVPVYKRQLVYEIGKFYPAGNNLINGVEYIKYEETDLVALINKINKNKVGNKGRSLARFFAGIAINSTQTTINNVNYYNHQEKLNNVLPKINVGIDLFGNPDVQKFVFRGELSFSYVNPKYISAETETYPVILHTNADYAFKQYTVSLTPQLLYNIYNADKLKIYIDGGIALNVSTYSNNRLILKKSGDIDNSTTTIEKPYNLDAIWDSFVAQTGVVLNKKIELSFAYIAGAGYSHQGVGLSSSGFNVNNQTASFGVRYFFGKH